MKKKPKQWLIYILHIVEKNGEVSHYIGLTDHTRWPARLYEHRGGHGAKLTEQARERGATIEGYIIKRRAFREDELDHLMVHPRESLCPICAPPQITPGATWRAPGLALIASTLLSACTLSLTPAPLAQAGPPSPDLAQEQEQEDLNSQAVGTLTRAALDLTAKSLARRP